VARITKRSTDPGLVHHPRLFDDTEGFEKLLGRLTLTGPVPSHKFLDEGDAIKEREFLPPDDHAGA